MNSADAEYVAAIVAGVREALRYMDDPSVLMRERETVVSKILNNQARQLEIAADVAVGRLETA